MARPVYIREDSVNSGTFGCTPFAFGWVLASVDMVPNVDRFIGGTVDLRGVRGRVRIGVEGGGNAKAGGEAAERNR